MVTNLVLFVLVIKGITCDRPKGLQSNQSKRKLIVLQVQAAMCCFVVVGEFNNGSEISLISYSPETVTVA